MILNYLAASFVSHLVIQIVLSVIILRCSSIINSCDIFAYCVSLVVVVVIIINRVFILLAVFQLVRNYYSFVLLFWWFLTLIHLIINRFLEITACLTYFLMPKSLESTLSNYPRSLFGKWTYPWIGRFSSWMLVRIPFWKERIGIIVFFIFLKDSCRRYWLWHLSAGIMTGWSKTDMTCRFTLFYLRAILMCVYSTAEHTWVSFFRADRRALVKITAIQTISSIRCICHNRISFMEYHSIVERVHWYILHIESTILAVNLTVYLLI